MTKLKQITVGKSKAESKKDNAQPGTLVIDREDTVLLVDQLASAKELEDLTTKEIARYRNELEPIVVELRNKAEAAGMFTKHVQVKGTGANARYVFKDAWAPIDPLARGQLEVALGTSMVNRLFTTGKSVRIKKGLEDKLLELLGDLSGDFLEVEHYMAPVEEFRDKRAEVRCELTDEQNTVLDDVVRQVGQRPSLSFK